MPRRGPNTNAGKAVVSLNAVRHGALSNAVVIPGVESTEEWESFRNALLAAFAPVGAVEHLLAEKIATLSWRARRVDRHEAEMIATHREDAERDFFKIASWREKARSVEEAQRNLEVTSAAAQLIRTIDTLSDGAPVMPDACLAVFEALHRGETALQAALHDGDPEDLEAWDAGRFRAALDTLRHPADKPAAFIEAVRDAVDAAIERRQAEIVETRDEINRLRRQRMLPEERSLLNIIRYEAHIDRAFYRAIHELEALQARRAGQPSNLTRLHVHGLPGG